MAQDGLPILANWFLKAPPGKKGKLQRRFCELHFLPLSAEVRYFTDILFDSETRIPRGKGQKGAIPIGRDSVILFNADTPDLAICNPTRTWRLTAESSSQTQAWGKVLLKVVHDCKVMDSGALDPGTRFTQALVAPDVAAPPPPTAHSERDNSATEGGTS
eukprot:m.221903 g.221903  ORF g.221903 m.221903 type:complete len:160 (+) comp32212_c0_seq1:262-741(+)